MATAVVFFKKAHLPCASIRTVSTTACFEHRFREKFGVQVPSIQQSAALALGRLANYSDDLAEAVVGNEILPQLVYSLSEQNRWGVVSAYIYIYIYIVYIS